MVFLFLILQRVRGLRPVEYIRTATKFNKLAYLYRDKLVFKILQLFILL